MLRNPGRNLHKWEVGIKWHKWVDAWLPWADGGVIVLGPKARLWGLGRHAILESVQTAAGRGRGKGMEKERSEIAAAADEDGREILIWW